MLRRDTGSLRPWIALAVAAALILGSGLWVTLREDGGGVAGTTTGAGQGPGLTGRSKALVDLPCEPVQVIKIDPSASGLAEGFALRLDGGECPIDPKPSVFRREKFAPSPSAETRGDEGRFVQLINEARAQNGAGPVTTLAPLVSLAREHSDEMARTGILRHSDNLSGKFPPEWEALGENVGNGKNATADDLHAAFMNSESHRRNILDPQFNYVGLGVRYASDGSLKVTEEFMRGPGGMADDFPVPGSEGGAVAFPSTVPRNEWYFADGYTGTGFQEELNILNPSGSGASVTVEYFFGGESQTQSVAVGPNTRQVVDVNAAVGPDKEVAVIVRSSTPVVAERLMRFVYAGKWDGTTALVGMTAPSTSFNFAEGYTGPNFEEYLTLFNPQNKAVDAQVLYQFNGGGTQAQPVALAPRGRVTVNVNQVVGPNREVAVSVSASDGIVVERPMYFAFDGVLAGGHTSNGLPAPTRNLTFAEGYTGPGFTEFLTILNPNDSPANVSITYLLGGGGTVPQGIQVGPRARFTIRVNDIVPDREVSVNMSSDQPIVAERPMYFTYKGRIAGGHDVVGTTRSSQFWVFPGGDTMGGVDTYLTVANPNPADVAMTVVFFDDRGRTLTRNFSIPANARQTVDVGRQAGSNRIVGAEIAASAPVVAEQPVYTMFAVRGGSDAIGYAF